MFQQELEEGKSQDSSKLQQSVEAMQIKLDEANAQLVHEREISQKAQKAVEEAVAIVHETPVPVEDTAKIEALTAEMEKMKVMFVQM